MRLVVTAIRPELSSPIDQRFGRTRCLLIVDLPDRATMVIDNKPEMHALRDAGVQAAQKVIDCRADGLITGHCGPKAYEVLKAAGVTVYKVSDGSVAEALDRFTEGELTAAANADADMVIGRNSDLEQCTHSSF